MSWTEIAPATWLRTSRRMSTTTTHFERHGVLVDPCWERDELEAIASEIGIVRAGFSTHAHHDHLLWHPQLGDGPRWATARTAELASTERTGLLEMLGKDYPDDVLATFGRVTPVQGDLLPETDLVVIAHDGHAPGHAAVFDPATGVLVAGDMLSDIELPLPFWPDDLPAYLAALDTLSPWVARATVLIPGHGRPTDSPVERLDADRRYLDAVLAGRVPDDRRIAEPGMREMYDRLVDIVREDR